MKYFNKATITLGIFFLIVVLFYFFKPENKTNEDVATQVVTHTHSVRFLDVTGLVDIQPEKSIGSIILNRYENTIKIAFYSNEQQIRELFSILVQNSDFLRKVNFTDYVSLQFTDDGKTVLLYTSNAIKDNYTKEEIIQSINGFHLTDLIEENRDKLNQTTPTRDTWK